jgi:beta-glucosidase
LTTRPEEAELRRRLESLTLSQKVRLLTGADFWALPAEPAIGLGRLVTSDGPAGVRGELWDERQPSVNVPSPTALAATWDEARVERLGRLLADEARAKGVHVLLAPTVNLHRTPYGGRHFECLSEDPQLTARIGAAYVRGVQDGGVAATVKHFVANDSETERFTADVRVDDRTLREVYLSPFEVLIREAGAWAVMAAYNSVNGSTMTESPLLRSVLHDEWGFDGVVMSDWGAARTTEGSARAGLDLVMPGPNGPWGEALETAVREGRVPEEVVDDKVLRILRLAARVGVLDAGAGQASGGPPSQPIGAVSGEVRATAAAGFVLVRNEGPDGPLLPLDGPSLRRVALLGPNAAVPRTLGGGSATVFPPYTISPLAGLRRALGPDVEVLHAPGPRSTGRIAVASPELLRPPSGGEDGVEVRLVAEDGAVLHREHRRTGTFNWMGGFGAEVRAEDVAAVEVRAGLRAEVAGEHVVGCSGLGRFRLRLGDNEAFDTTLKLAPGADPVEGLMRPPQHGIPVVLTAGEEVELVLRHAVEESDKGGGSFDIPVTSFQLNVDPPHEPDDDALARAVALASGADAALVVVGTTEEVESEGFDRDTLALPGRQDELVEAVIAANPRTVVAVNSGAPVLLPWGRRAPAVLLCWFPGQEFGNALADVLFGAVEPGGRMPTTWPASEDGLPSPTAVEGVLRYDEGPFIGYRGFDRDGREPLYPFGFGLGYTTWDYLEVSAPQTLGAADLSVRVRVRNTGTRSGREVVQVYASRPDSAVLRPARWLVGFGEVRALPGEEATVEVVVPARALAHWDTARQTWLVEPGVFVLSAGCSVRDLRGDAEVVVPGPPA